MRHLCLLLLVAVLIDVTDSVLENQLKKPGQWKKNLKDGTKVFLANVNEYRLILRPYLTMIPVVGSIVAAVVDFPLLVASIVHKRRSPNELKEIQAQIKDLKLSMFDQHVMQMMNANPIHQYVANIEAAWDHYQVYSKDLLSVGNEQDIKKLNDKFIQFYSIHVMDTDKLSNKLADDKFQALLAQTTHCHDNELEDFIIWSNKFVYFGNMLNKLYYELSKDNTPARLSHIDEVTYKSAVAVFKVREHCLSQIEASVKEDLNRLLNPEVTKQLKKKEKDYQTVATEIRTFFANTYRFYDWFVVLYKTKDVKHVIRENKHIMSFESFWTDEKLNVAVHWQLRGDNLQVTGVREAINSCVPTKTPCDKVLERLNTCSQKVAGAQLVDWISAVHIFKGEDTQSLDGQSAIFPYVDPWGQTATYFHKGACQGRFRKHKFFAMMRSGRDATLKDDCVGRRCGHGACKLVNVVGICECNPGYYGESCEKKLEHYNP